MDSEEEGAVIHTQWETPFGYAFEMYAHSVSINTDHALSRGKAKDVFAIELPCVL
jgi:hypothetical protein